MAEGSAAERTTGGKEAPGVPGVRQAAVARMASADPRLKGVTGSNAGSNSQERQRWWILPSGQNPRSRGGRQSKGWTNEGTVTQHHGQGRARPIPNARPYPRPERA